ncbi:MAG TPA: HD domain-containing protein [Bacteroidales bacterium]|nr:HD domain-containing protein [Bacteroidales bacterium]HPR58471.1 HD domain-containing protein [Bacteroidales bacterium]HRW96038.1 HD domain-containing protein [Bacteroidales bacterium]
MPELDFNKFTLLPEYFDHPSLLHGINHTYRVMIHVLKIGERVGLKQEIKEAFCAAFIHDMARKHDGFCEEHGRWAAQRKLPFFIPLFLKSGVSSNGIENIKQAVIKHSIHQEIESSFSGFKTIALLKDADALDRIRISADNLRPEYLRFAESHHLIRFAENLYYLTNTKTLSSFNEMLDIAKNIADN